MERSKKSYNELMAAKDLTEIARMYKGLYVALLGKDLTVVAIGKTFEEATEKAASNGYAHAEVYCVPKEDTLFMGGGYEIPLSKVHFPSEV
jgi:Family of unknown function (DUF5678)